MPKKYLISMTDDTMMDKAYYAARDPALGRIEWTDDIEKATSFSTRQGAENVLRTLEDMCRAARAYSVAMKVEEIEPKYKPEPEKAALETPQKKTPSIENWGSPRSVFSFGKLPPLRLFIRKNEAGEQVYSFVDELGNIRAVGTGETEGKDVAKAFCVYAYQLMVKKISEAEAKRSGK